MLGYYCFMNIYGNSKLAILAHTKHRMAVLIEFFSIMQSNFALFFSLQLIEMLGYIHEDEIYLLKKYLFLNTQF